MKDKIKIFLFFQKLILWNKLIYVLNLFKYINEKSFLMIFVKYNLNNEHNLKTIH